MPVATRLLVAFLLLIGAFVMLVGVAVFSLYALPTTDQFVAQLHGLAASA